MVKRMVLLSNRAFLFGRLAACGAAVAVAIVAFGASDAEAGWRNRYYNNQPAGDQQTQKTQPARPAQQQAAAPWPGNPYPANRSASVWPGYPNYGNPVGAAYSPAAGLRQGQFFGTFGSSPG